MPSNVALSDPSSDGTLSPDLDFRHAAPTPSPFQRREFPSALKDWIRKTCRRFCHRATLTIDGSSHLLPPRSPTSTAWQRLYRWTCGLFGPYLLLIHGFRPKCDAPHNDAGLTVRRLPISASQIDALDVGLRPGPGTPPRGRFLSTVCGDNRTQSSKSRSHSLLVHLLSATAEPGISRSKLEVVQSAP